jgi:acetyl-CoA/propionyl-CoA carboxylase biotin carboxyl carrier protein
MPAQPVNDGVLRAPFSGTLQAWTVADGIMVQQGDGVAVMEAMKMETQLVAQRTGRITLQVPTGAYYAAGTVLARIDAI